MAPPPAAAAALAACILAVAATLAGADDPYRFFTWNVTYGSINPLGSTPQQVTDNATRCSSSSCKCRCSS